MGETGKSNNAIVRFQSNCVWTYPSLLSCTTQSWFLSSKNDKRLGNCFEQQYSKFSSPSTVTTCWAQYVKWVYMPELCNTQVFKGSHLVGRIQGWAVCLVLLVPYVNWEVVATSANPLGEGWAQRSQDELLYHLVKDNGGEIWASSKRFNL